MDAPITLQPADEQARTAILEHHAQLRRDFDARVGALRAAVSTSTPYEQPLADLVTFLAKEVLPHATAEEHALYSAAATDGGTGVFIDAMKMDHRELEERERLLTSAGSATEALAIAEGAATLFALHVDKENDLLLPALVRIPGASLAALLEDMHHRLTG